MLQVNSNGTYAHERLVNVRMNALGHLEITDSTGMDAYIQFDVQETLEYIRFIDGDIETMERGWPCVCAMNDEMWMCLNGIEY